MTFRRPLSSPARRPTSRLALEPRIVFDGAMPVAATAAAAEHHEVPAAHAPAVERNTMPAADYGRADANVPNHGPRNALLGLRPTTERDGPTKEAPADSSATDHEIAFVDSSVADIEAFMPGFKGEVITIQPGSDGFDQIAAALAGRTDITAIHILGHGGVGSVSLGDGTLDATSMATRYAADLATISAALAPHGDILLYACDVAAGAGGQAFISRLAAATGDVVAASTDATGAAALGGNWVLEAHTGQVDAKTIDASGWNGLLIAPVLNLGGTTNSLIDGNFDARTQPVVDGDNLQGTTYGAFSSNGAQIDVIHVNGSPYASGPDNADTGNQYVTLQGGGTLSQSFTVSTAQTVSFGASFAIANPGSYLASVESASIVDSNGTTVATTLCVLAVTSNTETFYPTAATVALAPGTYTFVLQTGANVDVDSAFVIPGATYNTLYTPSAAPVPVAASTDSVTSLLGPTLASATVTIVNPQAGDLLSKIAAVSPNITVSAYNTTTHAITLTGTDTLANYAAALEEIGFSNSTANPAIAQRTINVVVNDGATNSNVAQNIVTIDYAPVANADSFSTPHNVPITVDVTANDTDASLHTFTVDKVNGTAINESTPIAVTGGTVTLTSAGSLLFTPTTGYIGSTSFTYNVIDVHGQESAAATVSGTVTDQPPVVDLNSTSASNQDLVNGTFTGGAAGWTATGTGTASNNYYYWDTDGGVGTLTQSSLTQLNRGYGTQGAAAVTFDLAWNNGSPDSTVPATLDLTIGGVLYARFTTSAVGGGGPTAQVGTFTYFNGASGPVDSVTSTPYLNWTFSHLTVNLPANVAANGDLVLSYNAGTGGYDDIAIDNVSVVTRTDPVAGNNYSTSYTENAIPTSIASSNTEIYDNDDTTLVSATVVLANAQAGDVLTQIANFPPNITVSQYNEATHTVTLTGSGTMADYATALKAIGYSNTTDKPSATPRTINITVNDGLMNSSVSTTTVNVIPVNDPPVVNLVNNANLLIDGDFENNVQPNIDGNNLKGTTYGAFTTTAMNINIVRVDGAGYADAPDFAYSGSQYLDLQGDGSVSQAFTLSSAQTISFGGAFANRENGSVAYTPPATTINILDASGTVVATASTVNLTQASGNENWYLSTGTTSLAAGNYTFRVTMGDYAQLDTVYVRNVSGYTSSYTEGAAPTPIAGAGDAVTDLDNTTMASATIVLTNAQALDQLSVIGNLPTGITASAYNSMTGTLTLSGIATSASYAAAIAQVGYSSTSQNPSATPRVIDVTVNDGTSDSNVGVATISVIPVDNAPTSTAPASVSSPEDTTLAFTGGNTLSVADVDSPTLTVSLNVGHGTLTLGTTTGLAFTTGNGTANTSMTFSGTQADIDTALTSLTYRPSPDYNGSDTLGFNTSDGSLSAANSVALTITPVADITPDNVSTAENTAISFNAISGTNGATPDTFSDPNRAVTSVTQGAHGSVTFNADGTLTYTPNTNFNGIDTFNYTVTAGGTTETATETVTVGTADQAPTSTAPTSVTSAEDTTVNFTGGNALTVSDVDSPNLTVSLNVGHGTLTLGTTTGLTFTTGNGTANTSMTFSGTQAQIDSALASLTYRPSPDYNGTDTLGFTTSDGSLSAVKSVALTITPVADITPDNVTTNENTAISFNAITGTNGATPDTFSDPNRAVTSVTQGAHGSVAFNADGTLTYTPNTNFSGTDTFTYTVTAGGTTETATETMTVNFVDQAPTSTAPTAVTSAEDTTLAFTGGNALSVADVDSPNLTVSLNVGHGTLTLGTTTGLTFTTGNGTANASMTFSGTQAQIDNALASLTYRPSPDYNGGDTLGFTTSDGSLSAANSVALTITPVANITPDSVTTNENTTISFNAITGTNGATPDTFSDPNRAVTSVTQGQHGTVIFNADGTLTYTPNTNFYGSDSFSYTVTAGGSTETAPETVTVTHVDQPPVANNGTFTAAEDATATIDVRANVTNPDNEPLTVTQINGQPITAGGAGVAVTGGTITLGSSGDLIFTPTAYFRGSTSFSYTIADPSGAISTATVNGTITPVNHPPNATDDTGTIDEDHNTTGNVLTNDSDPDGDALAVSAVNGNAASVGNAIAGSNGGLFTIQSNGSYAFATNGAFDDLAAGQSRTTSVSYTASDGQGGTANATVTITVTGVNHAPVANPDSYDTTDTSGSPNGLPLSSNVLTNDTDAQHYTLSVSAVDGSASLVGTATAGNYGTLTLNANGAFTYAVDRTNPAVLALTPGQTPLTDQFTYTASDGQGDTASTTLTIRVQGTNDGPIAGNDSNSIAQGQTSATGNVITGVRTDGSGTTTTVPSAMDTDPGFTLNVDAIRLPSENPGTTVTSTMTGSRTSQYGTLTIDANGNYTYVLNNGSAAVQALVPGQPVTDMFVYTVTDGVHTVEATITVSIDGINDPPVAQNDSFTTAEGTSATIDVRSNDSDPDHDPIRVTAVNGTAVTAGGAGVSVTGGVVTLDAAGDLIYTPSTYYRGSPSFTYTIEDPSGASATATVSGTVTPVNHAPTAVGDTFTTTENAAVTIDVLANDSDVDGDAIGVTQINGNAITAGGPGVAVNGGVVTLAASGNLLFTPGNDFHGSIAFDYTIADPSGATASAAVNGNVTHVNQPPVAVSDQFTSPQNATATIDVLASDSDPDGDAITVTKVNGTSITAGGAAVAVTGGTVILDNAGNLEFTPTGNYRGSMSFSYTISDPSGATGSATVSGTVTPFNHPPVAAPDSFIVTQGAAATIDARANDTDPDGDPLTITQVDGHAVTAGGPAVVVTGGTVALDGAGNLVFTANAGYLGATTFAYTVSDPSGATSTATINGTVLVDHAPVANPDSFASAANTPTTINVRANDTDADNDPLTVTQINGTAIVAGGAAVAVNGGTVALDASGNLVFTPTTNFIGATSFTYTISDPAGMTASATVSGTIGSPGPVPVDDAFTIPAGTVAVVDVRANDADVGGSALTVTQIDGTAIVAGGAGVAVPGGTVTLDASGDVVFTPTSNFAGSTSFTYTVMDASGATSMATVNGIVTRGLHEPMAVPDTINIPENAGPTIVDVRGNDIDANGDPLTITQINGLSIVAGGAGIAVAGGTVTLDASGDLVFTPTANVNGPVGFSYTISDPSGSRSTASVSIAVTPGAHAPMAVADTFTVAENAGATALDVRGNAVDADNNPLTITQIDGHAIVANGPAVAVTGGSVMLDAAGNLFFTPTAGTNGPVSFSYTLSDPSGSSSTADASVDVAPGAHAPLAMPDRFTISENAAATVLPVLGNDVDVDNNPLTITRVDGQAITAGGAGIAVTGGVLNLDIAGRLLFTPAANFNGPVTFTYTISDPAGSQSTTPVTLNVAPLDIGPVARPDQASGSGMVTVYVLANDSDASGSIDVSSVQLAGTAHPGDPLVILGQGTFTIDRTTGAITFTPVAGFIGTATASYSVADSDGLRSAMTPLSTTVTASDHAPVANPDAFTVAENSTTTINVLANDTDADGDALSVTQVDGQAIVANGPAVVTASGTFTLDSSGNLSFTPTPNSNGPITFTYTITDPSGATSTVTVNGSVTPSPGAPVAAPDVGFGESGGPITIAVLANDRSIPGDPFTITAIDGHAIVVDGPGVAIAGGVVTLAADGTLQFIPNASNGPLGRTSFTYTITSLSGASSSAVVSLDLFGITNPPLPNGDGFGTAVPAMPSGSPQSKTPALFVLQSVDDIRSEFAVQDPFGHAGVTEPDAAEIVLGLRDDLDFAYGDPFERIGLIGRSTDLTREAVNAHADSLFVQHAVRYEELLTNDAQFVHRAVQRSEQEAQALALRTSSPDGATLGATALLDPFALANAAPAAPIVDVVPPAKTEPPPHRHETHRQAMLGDAVPIDALSIGGAKHAPASGFSAQLRHSSEGLRVRQASYGRPGTALVARDTQQASPKK